MREPVKAEMWMRLEGAEQMHHVGTVTYDEAEIQNGQVTLDGFSRSVTEFVAAMNKILAQRQEHADG